MTDNTLTDPLGRFIRFSNFTWFGHILKRHPEMRLHRSLAEAAITDPIQICFSSDMNSRLYYGNGPRSGIMIVVVADVVDGYLKTAHLVRRIKGVAEWSRPTP